MKRQMTLIIPGFGVSGYVSALHSLKIALEDLLQVESDLAVDRHHHG